METKHLGRTCEVCRADERAAIEGMLLAGSSFRRISRQFPPISEQSVSRHCANHLGPEMAQALRISGAVRTSDLIERLGSIADDAANLRATAIANGDVLNALRAGEAETKALVVLLERLGISETQTIDLLAAGEKLAISVGQATRRNPAVGTAVAERLHALGSHEDAEVLLRVTEKAQLTIRETSKPLEGETT